MFLDTEGLSEIKEAKRTLQPLAFESFRMGSEKGPCLAEDVDKDWWASGHSTSEFHTGGNIRCRKIADTCIWVGLNV